MSTEQHLLPPGSSLEGLLSPGQAEQLLREASYERDQGQDGLDVPRAIINADPFAVAAAELAETYEKLFEEDERDDLAERSSIQLLGSYALVRMERALKERRVPSLVHSEKVVLRAFQEERRLVYSQVALVNSGIVFSSSGLASAVGDATARYRYALRAGNTEKADGWARMSGKIARFGDHLDKRARNLPLSDAGMAEFCPEPAVARLLLNEGIILGEIPDASRSGARVAVVEKVSERAAQYTDMNYYLIAVQSTG
ncbi:hypothetical protein CR970_04430 [Candidatus Saccharibacteria bacterium]|nr:MAG: hypothetical protein CR970_04430 [Candidatus Saccharibacteria bacterium]